MFYKVSINYANGFSTSRANVWAKTSAKTMRGICKAIGKAVADQLGTDAFELANPRLIMLEHGTPRNHTFSDLRNGKTLTRAEERAVVDAAQDRLFEIRYR